MRGLVCLVFLAVPVAGLGLAQGSELASFLPPASDVSPVWAPDGSNIAYDGYDVYADAETPFFIGLVRPDVVGGAHRVARGALGDRSPVVFSPDSSRISYETERIENEVRTRWLAVANADGAGERLLLQDAAPLLWPYADTILFRDRSGVGSIRPDGTNLLRFRVSPDAIPSPDGKRFAYAVKTGDRTDIEVVDPDGTNRVKPTAGGTAARSLPLWSPDSTRIAYLASGDRLVVAGLDGSAKAFSAPGAVSGAQAWAARGDEIIYSVGPPPRGHRNEYWLVRLSLTTGKSKRLAIGVTPSYSPDGRSIAFAAVGPCGLQYYGEYRHGIYVMQANGARARRLTNDCHIVGTARHDTLRGTRYYDIISGLAGNDTLYANDGYYAGDTLLGGPGNDVLHGETWNDTLNGGPGGDTLEGGRGQDILVGGPGHDRIDGEGGRDSIYAADGQRDEIRCGTNGPASGNPERDVVAADRFDIVSSDCEIVHRV